MIVPEIQGCPIKSFDQLNNGHQRCHRIEICIAACVDLITAAVTPTLAIFHKLSVRISKNVLLIPILSGSCDWCASATTTAKEGLLERLRVQNYFWWPGNKERVLLYWLLSFNNSFWRSFHTTYEVFLMVLSTIFPTDFAIRTIILVLPSTDWTIMLVTALVW